MPVPGNTNQETHYDLIALRKPLEEFTPEGTDRALEVGCGYGRLTLWIDDLVTQTDAVDPNENAIADAKEQYPQIDPARCGSCGDGEMVRVLASGGCSSLQNRSRNRTTE